MDANANSPIRFCRVSKFQAPDCSKRQHIGTKRSILWPSKYANMHFWSGLCPGLCWGSSRRFPRLHSRLGRRHPSPYPAFGARRASPRIPARSALMQTYHSHLISHMSVRLFLHRHCHHPLLLLTSTPDSKLIFSTNLFLHSSSTFPSTGLTPRTPGVFRFSRACRF